MPVLFTCKWIQISIWKTSDWDLLWRRGKRQLRNHPVGQSLAHFVVWAHLFVPIWQWLLYSFPSLPSCKVYRINTKYNVLYVKGQCPGSRGDFLYIDDAWKKHTQTPPFPTYFPNPDDPLPEDLYAEEVQQFTDDSIAFAKSSKKNWAVWKCKINSALF